MSFYLGTHSNSINKMLHMTSDSPSLSVMKGGPVSTTIFHSFFPYIEIVTPEETASATNISSNPDYYFADYIFTDSSLVTHVNNNLPLILVYELDSGSKVLYANNTFYTYSIESTATNVTISCNSHSLDSAELPVSITLLPFLWDYGNIITPSNDIVVNSSDILVNGVSLLSKKFLNIVPSLGTNIYDTSFNVGSKYLQVLNSYSLWQSGLEIDGKIPSISRVLPNSTSIPLISPTAKVSRLIGDSNFTLFTTTQVDVETLKVPFTLTTPSTFVNVMLTIKNTQEYDPLGVPQGNSDLIITDTTTTFNSWVVIFDSITPSGPNGYYAYIAYKIDTANNEFIVKHYINLESTTRVRDLNGATITGYVNVIE